MSAPFTLLSGRDENAIAKADRVRKAQQINASIARAVGRAHSHGYRRAVRAYRWMIGYGVLIGFAAGYFAGVRA